MDDSEAIRESAITSLLLVYSDSIIPLQKILLKLNANEAMSPGKKPSSFQLSNDKIVTEFNTKGMLKTIMNIQSRAIL